MVIKLIYNMQACIDSLNTYFKNKASFYNLGRWNNNDKKPADLIVELNKLNYNFTKKDFDNYLVNATYQKKNSYITYKPHYESAEWENSIKIMFTKCTPTDKQISHLISCYRPGAYYNKFIWVDALVTRNYKFTDDQKQQLVKIGYDVGKIYSTGIVTLEELKNVVTSAMNQKTDISKLKEIVQKNKLAYDDDFIESLLHHHPERYYNDIIKRYHTIMDVFFNDNVIKITENINNLLVKNNLDTTTIQYFLDKGLVPNKDLFAYCATLQNGIINILTMHIKFALPLTIEIINSMMTQYNEYRDSNIKYLESIGYEKILLDKMEINGRYGYKTFNYVPLMNDKNIVPNKETFNIACMKHNQELFDYCISHKMIPKKEQLIIALETTSDDKGIQFVNKLLCYKIIPDSECLGFIGEQSTEMSKSLITLLMKFGYKPSINDVKKFIEHRINIDNLDNLGFKYDDNMYYLCHIYNNWQYDDKFKLKNDKILGLRQLCRKQGTSDTQVREYMKENNVKLDYYCLEHALKINKYLADWMFEEFKCKPTPTTFYWITYRLAGSSYDTQLYHQLLDIYKIDDAYLSTPIH